ncbi:M20/M25/M40 family metallo-hydrolase [Rivibacter subsaxonicus]|nr:M20/M25/M40 family metallo-hydrolase [Rivibacter subsaxonicus]
MLPLPTLLARCRLLVLRAAAALSLAGLAALTHAAEPPLALPVEQPLLRQVAAAVSAGEQRATIEKLVGFGTRHTLSDTVSETRGIGAARRWVQARFSAIGKDCGGCLEVITPSKVMTGRRIPQPTEVMNVVAIQRGTSDPERVIVISGHLDSRASDIMDATSDAPGANDDASGVAAVIEAARVLSKHRFRATLVYAALSGEEQGLLGGQILVEHARAQGWKVQADLNNDIIGNIHGQNGVVDNSSVRVFSEGTRALETPEEAKRRRYNGGELDAPSRNIARYMAALSERYLTNLRVNLIYRTDRFGRGGDQVAFLDAGFPAVRVTEANEHYHRQHQDLRVEAGVHYGDTIDGVDFPYLAQVTRLNLVTMAAMAQAPGVPTGVAIEGAVTPDTTVKWQPVKGATAYRVWWRDTIDPRWRFSRTVAASGSGPQQLRLPNIVIDDWFFGVSAIGADGHESPVVFPGEAGAF